MISTIAARRLLGLGETVEYPLVTLEDGRVNRIESLTPSEQRRVSATHYFPEATLVPAYVDVHIHGCAGHDVMEATPEALHAIGDYLASRGVGAYFPTTVTSPKADTLRALGGMASEIEKSTKAPVIAPLRLASISKARFCPISSAASTEKLSLKPPLFLFLTASGRPPKERSPS